MVPTGITAVGDDCEDGNSDGHFGGNGDPDGCRDGDVIGG